MEPGGHRLGEALAPPIGDLERALTSPGVVRIGHEPDMNESRPPVGGHDLDSGPPPRSTESGSSDDEIARTTRDLLDRAEANRDRLLKRVRAIAAAAGGRTAREETSVKGADRVREKIAELVGDGRMTVDAARERIADALRFTVVPDDDLGHYRSAIVEIVDALREDGIVIEDVRDFWQSRATYVGFNIAARDADVLFEVQIHTVTSLRLAQANHRSYERLRALDPSSHEARDLREQMRTAIERDYPRLPRFPGIGRPAPRRSRRS